MQADLRPRLRRAVMFTLVLGVGLWVFGALTLFESPYMAAIPPLTAAACSTAGWA